MLSTNNPYQCQVIGAGAAGIGILIALYNAITASENDAKRQLQKLLDDMLWIEAGEKPGGILGQYQINANTHAADAVACIADDTPLVALRDAYLKITEVAKVLISLPRLDELLVKPLCEKIIELLGNQLLCKQTVNQIAGERGIFRSYDNAGQLVATSRSLVICCGGKEVLLDELKPWADKTEFGGNFLRRKDLQSLPKDPGPIVVSSASHSGFSCVWRLLEDPLFSDFAKDRDIVILQRRPQVKLRCHREVALQYGLEWDEDDDVCPKTGRIFANGGLRKDAKYLFLNLRDGKETRARIEPIEKLSDQQALLDSAALVVQCAGFVADPPEIVIDGRVRKIENKSSSGEVVDAATRQTIHGLFACGLGMHVTPEPDFRGEKSFDGSINGLQSYPLAIAPRIIQQLCQYQQEFE